ncbi:CAP domain-containing protein [Micromonospora costi]|uniref:CAP domain-containing protein n=1 Tax=Micromonospora costi TaxID=1530042 RepID=UPI0033E63FA7
MYGWTDPNDPDGATRRPEQPTGEPAWLTDRPAPRSAYLFGDDPDEPADRWRDQPTGVWRHDADGRQADRSTGTWRPDPAAEAWHGDPTGRHDEPAPHDGQPTGGHHRDLPTGGWADEEARPRSAGHPYGSGGWPADRPTARPDDGAGTSWPSEGGWAGEAPGSWTGESGGGWAGQSSGSWAGESAGGGWADPYTGGSPAYGPRPGGWDDDAATGALHAVDATAPMHPVPSRDDGRPGEPYGQHTEAAGQGGAEGRHRSRRRIPRPLVIGGAAAAATLVVSLGVGALAMPGDDGAPGDPSAVDDTVAAAPAVPTDEAPAEALTAPSPTASPSTVRPSPSATRTTRPTPAPSRTTAPSRRTERSVAPSTGGTTKAPSAPTSGVSAQAREVVDLVNAERAKAGCDPVSIDDKLMTAAQRHSQDQADHQNMSHDGSDGSDPGDRIERVGYEWRTYGENVAWNQKTPAAVMDAWMNSPGHRANILNCAFTEIGVGIASSNGPYWTQDFAAPR